MNERGTEARASSTALAGMRATVVSRSTVAPWASSTSSARSEWNMAPVSASTSSAAAWMRSTSAGLTISSGRRGPT